MIPTTSGAQIVTNISMKVSSRANRASRAAVKKASRSRDNAFLKNGGKPEDIQRKNSIFPQGFFDNARISNLAQAVGR